MILWQLITLMLIVPLGGGLAIWVNAKGNEKRWRSYLPILLSFSGAYLLSIAILELIPHIFEGPASSAEVWMLAGFLIQLLLDGLSQGVEHGHVHAHKGQSARYAIGILVGLSLHAFLEGLPLGAVHTVESAVVHTHHLTHADHDHLFWGIILHKLPAAFALGLLLKHSGYTSAFTWTCLIIFAAMSPIGVVTGEMLSMDLVWEKRILALVVGSFLHISTTILFEADGASNHGVTWRKLIVIIAGFFLAWISSHG